MTDLIVIVNVGAKRLNPVPNASNSAYGNNHHNTNHASSAAAHRGGHDATNAATPTKVVGGVYGLGDSSHKAQAVAHSLRNQGSASLSHGGGDAGRGTGQNQYGSVGSTGI